ncbi:MAG TPA: VWA domain-containing protein [Archaeoglobus profundus]|nr:VWA domain-containing protein [Archaeoglobus profundus]
MFIQDMKPECRLCEKEDTSLDQNLVRDLLYSIFNPYYRERSNLDVSEFIKKHIENEELKQSFDIFSNLFNEIIRNSYINTFWMDKLKDFKNAKKKAWNEIKSKIKRGKIKRKDISVSDLVTYFYEEIIEDLIKEGYIERVVERVHRKVLMFSSQAEKLIGEKVLQLSLQELDKSDFGEHVTEKEGISIFLGYQITEYDPFVHTFDMIDIQESLIKSALKDPNLRFEDRDLVARIPKHVEKCVYVMLIDVSDSMRGKKIIGAIEAALALKNAIRRNDYDELYVVAFNHNVKVIKEHEILNLEVRGRTDIGLALRKAREILKGKKGSKIVFLITDGEPTSSYNPYLTPSMCAIKEAENLRTINAHLTIIMLGKDRKFIELCNKMARVCRNSNVLFFADPLNLKKFFVKSYIKRR